MRFSISTHLLCLSLETLTSIIRTGEPILVELMDLVKSVTSFLSQMNLLRWLTFLLGSLVLTLKVLLFCIYFFPLKLVFILQWLSLHWEIIIMLFFSVSTDFPTNSKQVALFWVGSDWNWCIYPSSLSIRSMILRCLCCCRIIPLYLFSLLELIWNCKIFL